MKRRPALHLFWAIPIAILLCVPLAGLTGISWCGISGCSSGGWGISTDYVGLAIGVCIGAAIIMAVPLSVIPWLRPLGLRIVIAVVLGAFWGLLIAVVTHGPHAWHVG